MYDTGGTATICRHVITAPPPCTQVWTVLASNAVLGAAGLATPFCKDFASFSAARFIMGLSHVTFFAVFLMLGERRGKGIRITL